tara:strand:+ start:1246 stop:2628 length:1383 start_codon:yes stop_codon:yes gene_type:complete
MALTYNTIFGRLGRLWKHAEAVRDYQGTLDTQYASTVSEYSGGDLDQIANIGRTLETRKNEATHLSEDLLVAASKTLVDMTDANFTLVDKSLEGAIRELIKQMIADSASVDGNSVTTGSVTAGGSNVGNGTLLYSAVSPIVDRYGNRAGNIHLQNVRTETITARCIGDQTSAGIDENAEVFAVNGQRAVPRFDQDWPTGSGARYSLPVVSPNQDGGRSAAKNVTTNGDYEDFTSNAPDRWSIVTGVAGTHILPAGAGYTGSNALKLVGDGSTAPKIRQRLRLTAETLGQINPDVPYSISFAIKRGSAAAGAGIKVSVQDSGGTILNNSIALREMSASIAHGSITTSYQLVTNVCMAPPEIPKGSQIVVEATGNITNASEIFIDHVTVAEMRPMGPGLGAVQLIPGSTAFRYGDTFSIPITNNLEGSLAKEMDRFFDMQKLNLGLPGNVAGGETISDSLFA